MNGEETNMYIRVLAQDRSNLTELNRIETALSQVLEQNYNIESENRIQEKRSNDEMIQGSQIILGSFCGLLAVMEWRMYFLIHWDFYGRENENLPNICPLVLHLPI